MLKEKEAALTKRGRELRAAIEEREAAAEARAARAAKRAAKEAMARAKEAAKAGNGKGKGVGMESSVFIPRAGRNGFMLDALEIAAGKLRIGKHKGKGKDPHARYRAFANNALAGCESLPLRVSHVDQPLPYIHTYVFRQHDHNMM